MIEIKKRELEARLYFAFIASLKGYSVVFGKKGDIYEKRNLLKPGIVVFKSIGPNNTRMIDDLKKIGFEIVAWDEEAFVTPKKINFFIQKRINKENLYKLKYFFSWGDIEHDYLCNEFPEFKENIIKTGNPRIDILKEKFNNVLEPETKKISKKYGEFTLFLGNFGYINDINTKEGESTSDNLDKQGVYKKGSKGHDWVLGTEKIMRDVFLILPKFFNDFSKSFPNKKLIIRPHPSEKLDPYYQMIRGLKNIYVVMDGKNTLSWIKASNSMISTNCTTSVEAFLLNKLSINLFIPNKSYSYEQEFYLPPKVSINTASVDQTIETLKDFYKTPSLSKNIKENLDLNSINEHINKALYNYSSEVCSVKEMIHYLDKIRLKNNRNDKNINKFYFIYYLIRSLLSKLKHKILLIFSSQEDRNFAKYMSEKMKGFNYDEVSSKFRIISQAGGKDLDDFQINELIPKIFCIEKKD
jgi:surface carbohydrate biosynthesis protein